MPAALAALQADCSVCVARADHIQIGTDAAHMEIVRCLPLCLLAWPAGWPAGGLAGGLAGWLARMVMLICR